MTGHTVVPEWEPPPAPRDAAKATLELKRLREAELAAPVPVLEELEHRSAGPSERLTGILLEPLLEALRRERSDRLGGRATGPMLVDLRLPETMRRPLIAFFGGFVAALPHIGAQPMAAVFAPLVSALKRADDPIPLS
ncbi:hypothetical protein BH18CHL2_BH18CHL2_12160 [soil metagenome]